MREGRTCRARPAQAGRRAAGSPAAVASQRCFAGDQNVFVLDGVAARMQARADETEQDALNHLLHNWPRPEGISAQVGTGPPRRCATQSPHSCSGSAVQR